MVEKRQHVCAEAINFDALLDSKVILNKKYCDKLHKDVYFGRSNHCLNLRILKNRNLWSNVILIHIIMHN